MLEDELRGLVCTSPWFYPRHWKEEESQTLSARIHVQGRTHGPWAVLFPQS